MLITLIAALAAEQPSVTRDAFVRAVDARFSGIDANGDGRLEEGELHAAQQRILARLEEQRRNVAIANFAAADSDGNGSISRDEWIAAAAAAPLRVWTGGQLLGSLDSNQDGTVSLEEYRASQLDQFDTRDDDGDGVIDTGER